MSMAQAANLSDKWVYTSNYKQKIMMAMHI